MTMSFFNTLLALSALAIGVALALDKDLRNWLLTPRNLKLRLDHTMPLVAGTPTKITTIGVNSAGVAVPLHAVPVYSTADAALTLTPAADGLSCMVLASTAGTYTVDAASPEPTGTISGAVTGTFAEAPPDLVPVKLTLTFVDA